MLMKDTEGLSRPWKHPAPPENQRRRTCAAARRHAGAAAALPVPRRAAAAALPPALPPRPAALRRPLHRRQQQPAAVFAAPAPGCAPGAAAPVVPLLPAPASVETDSAIKLQFRLGGRAAAVKTRGAARLWVCLLNPLHAQPRDLQVPAGAAAPAAAAPVQQPLPAALPVPVLTTHPVLDVLLMPLLS